MTTGHVSMKQSLFLIFVFATGVLQVPAFSQNTEPFDPFSDEAAALIADEVSSKPTEVQKFLEPGEIRRLTELAKPSIVTVRQIGRDGERRGTGSGFVISKDGLIVTNLHVTGEGRPIEVEFSDGTVRKVVAVHASDRRYDLAVIRVDPKGGEVVPLKIADSALAMQGDLIVGFGAPQGLAFSVVPGVVSAIRELEEGFVGDDTPDYPMMQLAMPIEQGNSGGPVLNLAGEVLGIVTLRHRVTENLGFAVLSNDLQSLLDKPNPIPIARWQTIGSLNPKQWTPVMGGDWSQKGGIVEVTEPGEGFGGRSLLLSSMEVPEMPYEVSVAVRLGDEQGAAGLTFSADGKDVHYGFYPSGGNIRLTRFEGPSVYDWSILQQLDVAAYRPGEWNQLRVRVEESRITGWVNETQIFEEEGPVISEGKVGLCKFRDSTAEYRGFRVGKSLGEIPLGEDEEKRITSVIDEFIEEGKTENTITSLGQSGSASRQILQSRADELEKMAEELRRLSNDVYLQEVTRELTMSLDRPESEIDLFEVGLQIARVDDRDLDLEYYRASFSQFVGEAEEWLDEVALEAGSSERALALSRFLFEENGFHGSRSEYYHHANSYVNRVLDDREGLPVTLSVVFLEMARRLGITGVYGAPLPGKFMVGLAGDEETELELIDVFEGGKVLSRKDASREIRDLTGAEPGESAFEASDGRDIAVRMLRNLVDIEISRKRQPENARDYLELLLAVQPDSAPERLQRAILRIQRENFPGAKEDLDWLLDERPYGLDYLGLQRLRDSLGE